MSADFTKPIRWFHSGDIKAAAGMRALALQQLFILKDMRDKGSRQDTMTKYFPDGSRITVQDMPFGMDIIKINTQPSVISEEGRKIVDFNIYLGGWQNQFPYNWIIEKRSNSGKLLWTITENGDDNQESYVQSICTFNSFTYAVGDAWDYTVSDGILWKINKYNANRDVIWTKFKDYSGNGTLYSPGQGVYEVVVGAGGIFVLGKAWTDTFKIHLEKLDANTGDTVWTQEFNGGLDVYFYPYSTRSLILSDNTLFISFTRVITNSPYNTEGVLQKRDLNGNLIWEQVYNPSTDRDRIESISFYGKDIYASTYKYPSLDSVIKYSADGVLLGTLNITAQALLFDGSYYTADDTTLKRYSKDGTNIWSINIVPDGYKSLDIRRIGIEDDSILLAGDKIDSGYIGYWFVQRRSKADGKLLWESSFMEGSGCRALYIKRIETEVI